MDVRAKSRVIALFAAATLAWAAGCEDDDDDGCIHCCECSNDNDPVEYRPDAPGDCSTCEEQCQLLADEMFLGQKFDNAVDISCPD